MDVEDLFLLGSSRVGNDRNSPCCTFTEDCLPLGALINDKMGLTGAGVEGAKIAKRSKTHQTLSCSTGYIHLFSTTYLYAGKCVSVNLPSAGAEEELPCMLKLDYGSDARGMMVCRDFAEYIQHFNNLRDKVTTSNCPGIENGHGNNMIVMN
jgi:hypothetical protein